MTCSRTVNIPEGSTAMYQLIRCCPELTKCEGQAAGVAGDCEMVDAATARFYLKNQTHTIALTARTDYQVVPVIQGTVGVGGVDLAVEVTLPDASVMAYTVISDENGDWYLDLSVDADDAAAMLAVDTFKDGDALAIEVTATVGSCGAIVREISGTISTVNLGHIIPV